MIQCCSEKAANNSISFKAETWFSLSLLEKVLIEWWSLSTSSDGIEREQKLFLLQPLAQLPPLTTCRSIPRICEKQSFALFISGKPKACLANGM